jgi:hypothetical protein
MSALDRRRMLCLAMAMLPALASQRALAQAATPGSPGDIAPPPRPMVYTRRLERTLVGGAHFVVERRFAVRFTPSPSGFLVDGEQTGVLVETPEQLAPLAQMERERVELGIFPLELDQRGWIRSGIMADEVPQIEEAMRYVTQAVAGLERSEDERQALGDFITVLHQAGSNIVSSLPVDLFAPAESDREDHRSIQLPGVGGHGTVRTRFSARRDPTTRLMQSARREVVTTIAEQERRTTEIFTLTH